MIDARDALDRIKARVEEVTPGPWEAREIYEGQSQVMAADGWPLAECQDPYETAEFDTADAEFIAHSRSDVDRLTEALEAVLSGHKPDEDGECVECSNYEHIVPVAVDYPCLLVRIITSVLTEEEDDD